MNRYKWYPAWVYSVREDRTRENMEEYDRQQEKINRRCLEIAPNYYTLNARSRFAVRRQAEQQLGYC